MICIDSLAQKFEELTHEVLARRSFVWQASCSGEESAVYQAIVTKAFWRVLFVIEKLTIVNYSSLDYFLEPREKDQGQDYGYCANIAQVYPEQVKFMVSWHV